MNLVLEQDFGCKAYCYTGLRGARIGIPARKGFDRYDWVQFRPCRSRNNSVPFVHLRVHSEFSVVDGIVRIPDLIKRVAKLEPAGRGADRPVEPVRPDQVLQGARGAGIKPIAGCDVWITNDDDRDKPFRLLLLVRNHQGYLNLCELLTQSFLVNQGKVGPRSGANGCRARKA